MKAYLLDAISHNKIMTLSELKPYLWKNEINDLFLLTKHMELYLYSGYYPETIDKAVLGCYSWSKKIAFQLRNQSLIYDFGSTDDGLYTFKTDIANLPLILSLGAFKRRPSITGEWIREKERKLGHKVRPYEYCKIEKQIEIPCLS
ncbi:hypothetical protein ACFL6P_08565 [Candidatus Latescibacterota bacterium]